MVKCMRFYFLVAFVVLSLPELTSARGMNLGVLCLSFAKTLHGIHEDAQRIVSYEQSFPNSYSVVIYSFISEYRYNINKYSSNMN